jgi:predicted amidophosphoribosyltransferase
VHILEGEVSLVSQTSLSDQLCQIARQGAKPLFIVYKYNSHLSQFMNTTKMVLYLVVCTDSSLTNRDIGDIQLGTGLYNDTCAYTLVKLSGSLILRMGSICWCRFRVAASCVCSLISHHGDPSHPCFGTERPWRMAAHSAKHHRLGPESSDRAKI